MWKTLMRIQTTQLEGVAQTVATEMMILYTRNENGLVTTNLDVMVLDIMV